MDEGISDIFRSVIVVRRFVGELGCGRSALRGAEGIGLAVPVE
jgi:hypothetical protein